MLKEHSRRAAQITNSSQPPTSKAEKNSESYLLAFGDMQVGRSIIRAETLLNRFAEKGIWFVPRSRKSMHSGNLLLFYRSGTGFVACAQLRESLATTPSDRDDLAPLGLAHLNEKLIIDSFTRFKSPVGIRSIVNSLSFVTNKKYWGHSVRTNLRTIPQGDTDLILSLGGHSSAHQNCP